LRKYGLKFKIKTLENENNAHKYDSLLGRNIQRGSNGNDKQRKL